MAQASLPRTGCCGELQPATLTFNDSQNEAVPNATGLQPNEPVHTEYGRAMPRSNQYDDCGLSEEKRTSAFEWWVGTVVPTYPTANRRMQPPFMEPGRNLIS